MPRIGSSGTGGASNGGGSGNVTGTPPTDVNAITRWSDTGGTVIKNSPNTYVQDSGVIQAQGFAFNRQLLSNIIVPNHYTMVASDMEMNGNDILLLGDAVLFLL